MKKKYKQSSSNNSTAVTTYCFYALLRCLFQCTVSVSSITVRSYLCWKGKLVRGISIQSQASIRSNVFMVIHVASSSIKQQRSASLFVSCHSWWQSWIVSVRGDLSFGRFECIAGTCLRTYIRVCCTLGTNFCTLLNLYLSVVSSKL